MQNKRTNQMVTLWYRETQSTNPICSITSVFWVTSMWYHDYLTKIKDPVATLWVVTSNRNYKFYYMKGMFNLTTFSWNIVTFKNNGMCIANSSWHTNLNIICFLFWGIPRCIRGGSKLHQIKTSNAMILQLHMNFLSITNYHLSVT